MGRYPEEGKVFRNLSKMSRPKWTEKENVEVLHELHKTNDSIRLLTFQDQNVFIEINGTGDYTPFQSYSSTNDNQRQIDADLADKLGYYPIWCFSPLCFEKLKWDAWWFTDSQVLNHMYLCFGKPKRKWQEMELFEIEVPLSDIRDIDVGTSLVIYRPNIKKSEIISTYRFACNDVTRTYPTTSDCAYIEQLTRFRDEGFITGVFEPARLMNIITGDDEEDFE